MGVYLSQVPQPTYQSQAETLSSISMRVIQSESDWWSTHIIRLECLLLPRNVQCQPFHTFPVFLKGEHPLGTPEFPKVDVFFLEKVWRRGGGGGHFRSKSFCSKLFAFWTFGYKGYWDCCNVIYLFLGIKQMAVITKVLHFHSLRFSNDRAKRVFFTTHYPVG